MKQRKIILLGIIFGLVLYACEKDESPEEEVLPPRANFTYTPSSPVEGDEVV